MNELDISKTGMLTEEEFYSALGAFHLDFEAIAQCSQKGCFQSLASDGNVAIMDLLGDESPRVKVNKEVKSRCDPLDKTLKSYIKATEAQTSRVALGKRPSDDNYPKSSFFFYLYLQI